MSPTIVNPTPKIRFQAIKGAIDAHHTLVQTESFGRAKDFALLEYQRKLAKNLGATPAQGQQIEAMANAWKLQGIEEFMAEFMLLADKPVEVQPPGVGRVLDHAN